MHIFRSEILGDSVQTARDLIKLKSARIWCAEIDCVVTENSNTIVAH